MARVKAPLLRRRFAALTRAMRSRGLGIYRSVRRLIRLPMQAARRSATLYLSVLMLFFGKV